MKESAAEWQHGAVTRAGRAPLLRSRPKLRACAAVSAALVVLALSFPASGETDKDGQSRFRLFAKCAPMYLIVENLSSEAADIGLSRVSLQAASESRLRSARLYDSEAIPYLYVNVIVGATAFSISVAYKKYFYDLVSGEFGVAATWESAGAGTHGRNAGFIISTVSGYLDRFLVEFLRANEEACEKR